MDIQYCSNHNEPILFFDANISDPKKRGLCRICIQLRMNNLKTVEQEADEKQQGFDQLIQKPQKTIKVIQKLIDDINQYKKSITVTLDKLNLNLHLQIEIMEQLNTQLSGNQSIDQKFIDQSQQNLEQTIKIDQIQGSLKELMNIWKIEKNQPIQQVKTKYRPFEYKLLDKGGRKITQYCYAIQFNKDASLIFYGCHKLIKINKFENGQILNEIQELNGHIGNVTCLDYMNISNQLVSGSDDKTIIIWNINEYGQWIIKQKLCEHDSQIKSLILNQNEDLLVSGSADKFIKFWQRKSQNWICQKTIETRFQVCGLCLDDESEKLIACGNEEEVLVISRLNNDWIIQQTIKVQKQGWRVCFIHSNMFLFQPNNCEQLEFYEIDKHLRQFVKTKDVQVKSSGGGNIYFPCQFIKSREIIFVKNNAFLNIIRRQENGSFITHQSIDFQTVELFGRVTDDGLYLATWDAKAKEIQIRRLEYLE